LAHYKVVEPMIAEGAPIIIVIPGGVYGPGGSGWVMQLMHLFYEGRLPILIAPKMVHTYAHVEDIAEGHLLAAEKGKVGESYILAGPAIPLGEIVDFWALLTGRPSPAVRLPGKVTKSLAPVLAAVESMWPLPELLSEELIKQSDGTYMIRADKARVELGWRARSLHEGMSATFAWMAEATPEPERVEPAVGSARVHRRLSRFAGLGGSPAPLAAGPATEGVISCLTPSCCGRCTSCVGVRRPNKIDRA
jgi:nucleoside-diphosphate-sugar epimerase